METTLPYIKSNNLSRAVSHDAEYLQSETNHSHSIFLGESVSTSAYYEKLLKSRFLELKTAWYKDIRFISNSNEIVNHPAYLQIIELGFDVVPFLLEDLEVTNNHWFVALLKLTEENPVNPDHIGDIEKMKEDWISWGKNEGLV